MMSGIFMYLVWFSVWLCMTWPPTPKNMIIGAITAYLVLVFKVDIFSPGRKNRSGREKGFDPIGCVKRVWWFCCYVAVVLYECVKANIDIAYKVIRTGLPAKPAIIKVRMSLKTDAGVTFLANAITLAPGSSAIDVDKEGGFIYLHILYMDDKSRERSLSMVKKYETILRRVFE